MMSFHSPQRTPPGTYFATPAPNRFVAPALVPRQYPQQHEQHHQGQAQGAMQENPGEVAASTAISGPAQRTIASMTPVERAAKTVNEMLNAEARYPELDTYVGQGISSSYDPVEPSGAWAPFQKQMTYDLPHAIFEQYNNAQISTMMGLFAELNHAWVSIDNAVYLWNYTQPNPELLGFEDQPNTITAVQMLVPRQGVFVPAITKLLAIATVNEIILIGVSAEQVAGSTRLSLYSTKMSISVRGLQVNVIAASGDGRIFFGGASDNDIHELTYQQEEKWFFSRCSRINHTRNYIASFTPNFNFNFAVDRSLPEHVMQMAVDDSRSLLYTLSSLSTIRVFLIQPTQRLTLAITKKFEETLGDVGHMTSKTPLVAPGTEIISIAAITAQEASRFHLVAITSTGTRLYMSASSGYSWSGGGSTAPTSMQVQHIKFPPPERPAAQSASSSQGSSTTNGSEPVNTSTTLLKEVNRAARYPPGYFFCFTPGQKEEESLFISAPDTGRIAKGLEPGSNARFTELSATFQMKGRAEAVALATKSSLAATMPQGFANELAIQFDQDPAEVAILTNGGVTLYRRQRLVDIFYTAAKTNEGQEGREGSAKKFIRLYGRSETAATALAVACGEGTITSFDTSRVQSRDYDVQTFGRKVFIEYGGKPTVNENTVVENGLPTMDSIKPSSRHDGVGLFISRIVRSFWKITIATESLSPTGGLTVKPTVDLDHLRYSQDRLVRLKDFLGENKPFIEGLSGPESARHLPTKLDEISMQAEHTALHALEVLITHVIEGISFVQTLFHERIEEIVMTLDNDTRQQVCSLTFEELFSTPKGRELAKILVKGIIDRNISHGANVDTVADSLRRQCGGFCSAEDVVMFKAQEQIRKATDHGFNSEFGRNLLNESLRLYKQVADSMPFEQLQWAIDQYINAQFYAGAVNLSLNVALESDRGNRALSWIQDGKPANDPREAIFAERKRCYDLIHNVLESADQTVEQVGPDGQTLGAIAKRRTEAQEVIEESKDEAFQTDLYDWYVSRGQPEKLLTTQSHFVVKYLQRKSQENIESADLLWRYHLLHDSPYMAAEAQLELAQSDFKVKLDRRIEYLSRAKANAQIYSPGVARSSKQRLLHRITELLDIASVQDDILTRLIADERVPTDRRTGIEDELGYQILELTILYNSYADSAGYYDLCLLIYQAADHRTPTDIRQYWRMLLEQTHRDAIVSSRKGDYQQPYEAVADVVRQLGRRMNLSEVFFPVVDLIPALKRYAFEQQRGVGDPHWVVDVFLDLGVPPDTIFSVLEGMLYNDEAPFQGRNRSHIADDMLFVADRWFIETSRGPAGNVMGGEQSARAVVESLSHAIANGMSKELQEDARALGVRIQQLAR